MVKSIHLYSIPHLVHIETTYLCNAKCIFCYNPSRISNIDYEKLDKIVKSIHNSKIPHVYLIGGEPSLVDINKLNEYIDLLSQNSSVTIVTNGIKYLEGLSKNLACIGIPIHGDEKTHEYLNNVKGSYEKIISNLKKYIGDGFDVRCIPVLMSVNYNQMYSIIEKVSKLGVESVFVDRFESGGLGSKLTQELSPSWNQFKIALRQMVKAKKDFGVPLGFGTAIPFCIDPLLIKENIKTNCGAGITFAAINPQGDLRICNQSQKIYGNVLKEPIEKIWVKKQLNEFRDLSWVSLPCKKCHLLYDCVCGCKVDTNCKNEFCIDYFVRDKKINTKLLPKIKFNYEKNLVIPENLRRFRINKYLRLNYSHKEDYLITRYQTIEIDYSMKDLIKYILNQKGIILEKQLLDQFKKDYNIKDLRKIFSKLVLVGALDAI